MDFFQSQEVARRKTTILVVYFVFAVALIIASVYAAFLLIFLGADVPLDEAMDGRSFLGVTISTLMVVIGGSLYKTAALRGGGESVALSLGGVAIAPGTRDAQERRLLNVVEEMAIAAGTPVPPVYLLPEPGINAFAAGYSPSDAVIGVTRGAVQQLSRDELQGVIGHEFSHILNGDMRLNIRLMGYIFGILCLTVLGRVLLRTRGKKNPLPIFGLALMIVGSIGVFFGRLIKSAVSRQREYLADASAVQFTRNPGGLAGALRKIGGITAGSRLTSPAAEEASHMFFANGLGRAMFSLMATHPPLADRIKRIDPAFTGDFTAPTAPANSQTEANTAKSPPPPPRQPPPLPQHLAAAGLLAHIGAPQPEHVAYAAALLAELPSDLHDALHSPIGARAAVYGLVIADDPAIRAQQLQLLQDGLDAEAADVLTPILAIMPDLPPHMRIPLVEIAFTGLRQMSAAQYDAFCAALPILVEADDQLDLFEYTLQLMIVRHLNPHFGKRPRDVAPNATLPDVIDATVALFSTLACYGHDAEADAMRAFAAGFARVHAGTHRDMLPAESCSLALVGTALEKLSRAYPAVTKRILEGCVAVIAADQRVTVEEAELLRAVADALGCPAPPLLPDAPPQSQSAAS
ncbi:MAG: M48 family metallopeptidase [Verrucomicrobia bacterium]|nr:M48 family metallopeptidase [Verrucomicrobiota bacterium]